MPAGNEQWKDYYAILQIKKTATPEEIKSAYKRLAKIYHPDKNQGSKAATERMKEINQAHDVLSDPIEKAEYDRPKLRLVVDPVTINFHDVQPGVPNTASFVISNAGGSDDGEVSFAAPASRNPNFWVRVVSWGSVVTGQSDVLPLRVMIEAKGKDWGQSYTEYIEVTLDQEVAQVQVNLRTIAKPKPEPRPQSQARPTSGGPRPGAATTGLSDKSPLAEWFSRKRKAATTWSPGKRRKIGIILGGILCVIFAVLVSCILEYTKPPIESLILITCLAAVGVVVIVLVVLYPEWSSKKTLGVIWDAVVGCPRSVYDFIGKSISVCICAFVLMSLVAASIYFVPKIRRDIRYAKMEEEAISYLGSIEYYQDMYRVREYRRMGSIPGYGWFIKCPPTPFDGGTDAEPDLWPDEANGFDDIGFRPRITPSNLKPGYVRFQYAVEVSGDGQSFIATATGDPDGDGVRVTYSVTDKNPNPEIYEPTNAPNKGTGIYTTTGKDEVVVKPENTIVKWVFSTGNWVQSSPAIGEDGTVYVGSGDHNLYAINPDGTEKWRFETGGFVQSSPSIGADGTIYVGSCDNNLYAINPDGTEKWRFDAGGRVGPSPTIGADGTIYIGSQDNNLYAIEGSSGGLADTPWPMFRGNLRHTGRVNASAKSLPNQPPVPSFSFSTNP